MFWFVFCTLSLLCVGARVYVRLFKVPQAAKEVDAENFVIEGRKLQQKYLVVYLLATTADWLQGPYVYALYEQYGFSKAQIGFLFVAG
jgi:hypothetical protein